MKFALVETLVIVAALAAVALIAYLYFSGSGSSNPSAPNGGTETYSPTNVSIQPPTTTALNAVTPNANTPNIPYTPTVKGGASGANTVSSGVAQTSTMAGGGGNPFEGNTRVAQ